LQKMCPHGSCGTEISNGGAARFTEQADVISFKFRLKKYFIF